MNTDKVILFVDVLYINITKQNFKLLKTQNTVLFEKSQMTVF